MKISPEISFIKLIYKSLINYWKDLVLVASCVSILVLAVFFPHVFTYKLGRNLFVIIVFIALYLDYLSHLPLPFEKIKVRFYSFFEKYFLLILLSAISLFSIGALNEKLFSSDPAIHSLNHFINWDITIGGVMPKGDNACYFNDVQSFLKYGIMQLKGIYRPLALLVNAVFYKLSDENIITYYYLTSIMLILTIFWLGWVVKRHFNMSLAMLSAFCLCLFFSRFQGSFMTEMIGGIVGLFAFTALLDSIFRKNVLLFFIGIILLGLALQMRAGAIFILPLLVLYGAIFFRKKYWISIKTLFIGVVLVVLTSFSTKIQLSLLSQKFDTATNLGYLVYQIQVNSNDWRQILYDYPKRFEGLNSYDQTKLSNKIAFNMLKDRPDRFIAHYILKMFKAIKNPGFFTFRFVEYFPKKIANLFLILFFLTPILYSRHSKMHLLFWLLLIGLTASVLFSPLSEVTLVRAYAASISFNVIIFAISVANSFILLKGFRFTESGLHWDFYTNRKIVWLRFKSSISQIWRKNGIVQRHSKESLIYISIILTILAGPVILDKMRDYKSPDQTFRDLLPVQPEGVFLLSVSDTPHALFDPQNDFVVNDPLVISRKKFINNKAIAALPNYRFYLFNALNHIDFLHHRQYCNYIVLSEALLGQLKLDDVSLMLLKGEYISENTYSIFFVKEICKVQLSN